MGLGTILQYTKVYCKLAGLVGLGEKGCNTLSVL